MAGEDPLMSFPSPSVGVGNTKCKGTRGRGSCLLPGLLLLMGSTGTHGGASGAENDACLASESSDCSAAVPSPFPSPAHVCASDAEGGLCTSDPGAMFRRCSPETYCSDREDFGTVIPMRVKNLPDCWDLDEECDHWASENNCVLNPNYMLQSCPESCLQCTEPTDDENFGMEDFPIGVKQSIPEHVENEALRERFFQVIAETSSYMKQVYTEEKFRQARRDCRNFEEECAWHVASTDGEYCEDPADRKFCRPACQACEGMIFTEEELMTIDGCTPDLEQNAFKNSRKKEDEGDSNEEDLDGDDGVLTIDTMFRRIIGELPYPSTEGGYPIVPGVNYTAKVLSRPSTNPEIHRNMPLGSIDFYIGGPWIVVLDDFLTPEECDRMVELEDMLGRTRSGIHDEDEGAGEEDDGEHGDRDEEEKEGREKLNKEKGESEWRTSTTVWCEDEICSKDPVAERIQERIGLTTGVQDESYYEYLQLLRYVPGQYYKDHHDESGDVHELRYDVDGPRMLTFFLYLNDVEEGGETRFVDLMADDSGLYLDVTPKKGRALLWPSMMDEDVLALDRRTFHAALEVKKGIKYGANAWLHLRHFRDSYCDESALKEMEDKLFDPVSF